jgi:hypothetical protein
MNDQPTTSPTLFRLLVGIIDELFIQRMSRKKKKKKKKTFEPICLLPSARVSSECVSASVRKKNWGKKNPQN